MNGPRANLRREVQIDAEFVDAQTGELLQPGQSDVRNEAPMALQPTSCIGVRVRHLRPASQAEIGAVNRTESNAVRGAVACRGRRNSSVSVHYLEVGRANDSRQCIAAPRLPLRRVGQ